jgi:hypothetical protein
MKVVSSYPAMPLMSILLLEVKVNVTLQAAMDIYWGWGKSVTLGYSHHFATTRHTRLEYGSSGRVQPHVENGPCLEGIRTFLDP